MRNYDNGEVTVGRGMRGWVPASARTTGGGEDRFPPTVFAGAGYSRE